ncbi:hypothetical protein [Adoxophyes orana nucleopolyhedrovirus]|uniref:hypothetical protein n=1 Tax=Adoxophyes orana nucleopolyhedrovirus TaxID=542343 RepID=UPI0001829C3D|nr:hypothetical protein [Adoxophyes orana nucleopolyhedrovirus]ACF05402.1 hypothetical protein [Adoxophyes orana nucleopolyhedrovirus]
MMRILIVLAFLLVFANGVRSMSDEDAKRYIATFLSNKPSRFGGPWRSIEGTANHHIIPDQDMRIFFAQCLVNLSGRMLLSDFLKNLCENNRVSNRSEVQLMCNVNVQLLIKNLQSLDATDDNDLKQQLEDAFRLFSYAPFNIFIGPIAPQRLNDPGSGFDVEGLYIASNNMSRVRAVQDLYHLVYENVRVRQTLNSVNDIQGLTGEDIDKLTSLFKILICAPNPRYVDKNWEHTPAGVPEEFYKMCTLINKLMFQECSQDVNVCKLQREFLQKFNSATKSSKNLKMLKAFMLSFETARAECSENMYKIIQTIVNTFVDAPEDYFSQLENNLMDVLISAVMPVARPFVDRVARIHCASVNYLPEDWTATTSCTAFQYRIAAPIRARYFLSHFQQQPNVTQIPSVVNTPLESGFTNLIMSITLPPTLHTITEEERQAVRNNLNVFMFNNRNRWQSLLVNGLGLILDFIILKPLQVHRPKRMLPENLLIYYYRTNKKWLRTSDESKANNSMNLLCIKIEPKEKETVLVKRTSNTCYYYRYPGCFSDQPLLEKYTIVMEKLTCHIFNVLTLGIGYYYKSC